MRYCSARCRKAAQMARYRARQKGDGAPTPPPVRIASRAQIAEQLTRPQGAVSSAVELELQAARARLATLAAQEAQARTEAREARKDIARLRSDLQRTVRDAQFVSTAFVRTLVTHNLETTVGARIRERVTAWLPDGENPWR